MINKQVRFYLARELLFHKVLNKEECLKKSYILDENYLKCEFINSSTQRIDTKNLPKFYVEIIDTENEAEIFDFSLNFYKIADISFETNVMFLEELERISEEELFYIQKEIKSTDQCVLIKELHSLNYSLTKHSTLFLINHFKETEKTKKKEKFSLDETKKDEEITKLKRRIQTLEKNLKNANSEIEYLEIDLELAEQDIIVLGKLLDSTVNDFNLFIQLNKTKYPDIMDFETFSSLLRPYVIYSQVQ
jgi:hypothetical protein